jgi:endoglucanase
MLRSYYLQRCGVAINDTESQVWHAACHLQDGLLAHADVTGEQGERRPTTGGWHDAGDYGKYVATAAIAIARLLNLYELYPSLFPDRQLRIPESGNEISDLLDEVRVEMAWLLTLQRKDGAVYRKVSGMNWPKQSAPDNDTQPRYVYGISTPETAKFAAVAAMSARNFHSIDAAFARACLAAAQRAWHYLEQHPNVQVDWVEGDDLGSGKYLFSEVDQEEALLTDADDRLWAAVELFVTTQQERFLPYIHAQIPRFGFTLFEWKDPSALALITYYHHATSREFNRKVTDYIQTQLEKKAEHILKIVKQSGYRIANDRFVWGSNKMTAEEGITLVHAYKLTGNIAYWQAAVDQVDYLFGRNHFGLSFVSGIGEHAVQHVCHIPSRMAGITIPGLLVGGPNAAAQCGLAPKGLGPLSYIDHEESYATNENAIDYNASAIALIAMLVGEETQQQTESLH